MKLSTLIALITLVIGLVVGFSVCRGCSPKPGIEIGPLKQGKDTVYVTVHKTDTVFSTKTIVDVKTHTVVCTTFVDSSGLKTPVISTASCYDFDELEKDSTYIKVSICSESFSLKPPTDIRALFTYKGHDIIDSTHYRVDTLPITKTLYKPTPYYQDWKTYGLAAAVLVIAGMAIVRK